jgi:hypothetical protein
VLSIFRSPPPTSRGSVIFVLQILLVMLIPVLDDGSRLTPLGYDVAALAVATLTTWLLGYPRTAGAMTVWSIASLAWASLIAGDSSLMRLPLWLSMFVACLIPAVLCIKSAFSLSVPLEQRIFCGAASFVQLGFMFAAIHGLIGMDQGGSYRLTSDAEAMRPLRWTDFIWLSFSILTPGFGSLAPVSATAYAASTLEGLCGILFPATLIARIVSLPAMPVETPLAWHDCPAAVAPSGARPSGKRV